MKYLVWLLCLTLIAGNVMSSEGQWMFLNKNVSGMKSAYMGVVEANEAVTVLDFEVFGYFSGSQAIDGHDYQVVEIPGTSKLMEKGNPDLPKMTTFIALDDTSKPEIEILEEEFDVITLDRHLAPSKGHIYRNQNPEEVPYTFSAMYVQPEDKLYPETTVNLSEPFIFRDVRGVRVEFAPVRYNPAKKELRITKSAKIAIRTTADNGANVKHRKRNSSIDREFASLYGKVFSNYSQLNQATRYTPITTVGKLLIITHDDFYDVMVPFANWKKKAGHPVEMVKLSEVGKTSADIYNFIKAQYDAGGLAYIHLVGDSDRVPTLYGKFERAASDPCYTKLEGNDNVPDAIISRFSAATVEDVMVQVNRVISYESKPLVGEAAKVYRRAIGIASHEGNPTDYERAEWLREALENYNYDYVTKAYDPGASKAKVAEDLNIGVSLVNYIGHGSKTSWATTRFSNTDINALKNTHVWPVIWSVACVNGQFDGGSDCFAERWLKVGTPSAPLGAIAIFAASTNAPWVPPCDMQTEIIKEQLCKEKVMTVGGQAVNGILKTMDIWGTADKKMGNQVMEQYNIFGDSTTLLRSDVPKVVAPKITRNGTQAEVVVEEGLAVTFYNNDMSFVSTHFAGGDRTVRAELPENEEIKCTVYGVNIVPVVDMIVK